MNTRERIVVCGLKTPQALAHHACVVTRYRDSLGNITHTSSPVISLCCQWLQEVHPYQSAEALFFGIEGANTCPTCHAALLDSKVAAACSNGTQP